MIYLSLLEPKDGMCEDAVRVNDKGFRLFETCGSMAGAKIISHSNEVTLDIIASATIFPSRGFFLQYQGTVSQHVTGMLVPEVKPMPIKLRF